MIRPAAKPIHLDTSFLIRALDPAYPESAKLQQWLRARRAIGMSTLAWGEFLCGPLGEANETTARRIPHRLIPVGTEEAARAARLFNHAGRRRNKQFALVFGSENQIFTDDKQKLPKEIGVSIQQEAALDVDLHARRHEKYLALREGARVERDADALQKQLEPKVERKQEKAKPERQYPGYGFGFSR